MLTLARISINKTTLTAGVEKFLIDHITLITLSTANFWYPYPYAPRKKERGEK